MNNARLNELKNKYVAKGTATSNEVFAIKAKDAEVWDADGKRYIDFAGGVGVLNLGHCHPDIVNAVNTQLHNIMHSCQAVMSHQSYVLLAEKLCNISPVKGDAKALLLSTGSEALENSIKIARSYTKRHGVICFHGAFHGRTFMTMAMTGSVVPYKSGFGVLPAGVFHTAYPNLYHGISEADAIESLERVFSTQISPQEVAAIVIEPVQGEGGFYIAPYSFMKALRKVCDNHGIVLIADEVQSGFGRTGKMFAIQHSDIEADIITVAKSLAGGLPLSAVVGSAEIMDAPEHNTLGGTYSGNALSCAAALAVIEVFNKGEILQKSLNIGEKLISRIKKWQAEFEEVDNVRGLGSMVAFEFVNDKKSRHPRPELAAKLSLDVREQGLILLPCGFWKNSIRFLIPLTISDELLNEGLDIIESSLRNLLKCSPKVGQN